jgi:hypothetical protein
MHLINIKRLAYETGRVEAPPKNECPAGSVTADDIAEIVKKVLRELKR